MVVTIVERWGNNWLVMNLTAHHYEDSSDGSGAHCFVCSDCSDGGGDDCDDDDAHCFVSAPRDRSPLAGAAVRTLDSKLSKDVDK